MVFAGGVSEATHFMTHSSVVDYRDANMVTGIRTLHTRAASTANIGSTTWNIENVWRLDAEFGEVEHMRRQIYGASDTLHEGVRFGLLWVHEWPTPFQGNNGTAEEDREYEDDQTRIYIGTSRNGFDFDLDWVYAGICPKGWCCHLHVSLCVPCRSAPHSTWKTWYMGWWRS